MSEKQTCPIWGTEAYILEGVNGRNASLVYSPRAGGWFHLTGSAVPSLKENLAPKEKIRLSFAIWRLNVEYNLPYIYLSQASSHANMATNALPLISSDEIKKMKAQPLPSIEEKLQYAALALWRENEGELGVPVPVLPNNPVFIPPGGDAPQLLVEDVKCDYTPIFQAATASKNEEGALFLVRAMHERGLIKRFTIKSKKEPTYTYYHYQLTVEGHALADEAGHQSKSSSQGFVAMWFDDSMKDAREAIKTSIRQAGYEPSVIDEKHHINDITDEIIAEIRRSRFVVADFTGDRAGVYYESGFAKGLEIPVIHTCREDKVDELHFDTNHINHIVWKKTEDLQKQLTARISAVLGDGPNKQ